MKRKYAQGNDELRHIWDVERIWKLAEDLEEIEISIDQIVGLDSVTWFHEGGDSPTVRSVAAHAKRIMQADTGYPPILTEDYRVFDGMHRIARHLLDGKKNIMVKRFVKNPEPDIIEGTSLKKTVHKGSCLCGVVSFEVEGDIPRPDACHCHECRKFSGHYFVSADIPRSNVTINGSEKVSWYRIENVRRGFCSVCGSSLFWDPDGHDWTSIALGAFDVPTGTKMNKHIFVAEKSDYYEITDDLPQFQR